MKTTRLKNWTVVCAVVLTAMATLRASADPPTTAKPEKNYSGTVVSVDPQEHTLTVKGFLFSKKFNLGNNCTYVSLNDSDSTINELRLGEKVVVNYQSTDGVFVADRVKQEPTRYEGTVGVIDPKSHTMIVHFHGVDKTFQIADGCSIVLRDDKPGKLNDIQVGNRVTVTYETPHGTATARQIAQTSEEFTGMLTAIDLDQRTVKAKALFDTKKFNLGDNCVIVINGKADGKLSDLKPNEKLVFSYDEVNGINVVNRIGPAEAQTSTVATTGSMNGY